MLTRLKILFIARWYPVRNDPMFGLFVQRHAQAVQTLHDVTVIFVGTDNNIKPGKIEVETTNFEGIYEIKIYFGKFKSEIRNAIKFIECYLKALKISKEHSGLPSLVHVHVLSRTAFPALWLKYTKGINFIITEHWSRYLPVNLKNNSYDGALRKKFTRLAVSTAKAVTTVTENLALAMQALNLQNKYFITPNVADTNMFRLSVNKNHTEIKRFIHVSCFDEPSKNIKGIINAIKKLSSERNDFVLDIIGDGVDFIDVRKYAEATGLVGNRIFFHGLLTGEVLAEKMRDAYAMVMFSNYENLPCTIVESICSGVPVISTDVGGIKEHLKPDFGMLVKRSDETELYNALIHLLDNGENYNKENLAEYGKNHFSMTSSGKLFDSIYKISGFK